MKNGHAILKLIILIAIIALLIPLKEVKVKNSNDNGIMDSIYVSEVLDVSTKNDYFIHLNKKSWPSISSLNNEILIVDFLLKQSDRVSCSNDLKNNTLIIKVSAYSNCQNGLFSRSFFTDEVPSDTIVLASTSSYGQTGLEDYSFAYSIANVSYLKGKEITIHLEVLQGDMLVNSLSPRITVKKFKDQFGTFEFARNIYIDVLFYSILGLVLLIIILVSCQL